MRIHSSSGPLFNLATLSGMTAEPVHHSINYVELNVSDLERAIAFYGGAFGWEFTTYAPVYAGIKGPDGTEVGGLSVSEDLRPAGGPFVILYSEDLDASAQTVRDNGGEVTMEPYAFPGGRRFHFTDPSGNELGVWSTT